MECIYAQFRATGVPSPNIPVGARSVGHHTVEPGWVDDAFKVNHVVFLWGIRGSGRLDYEDGSVKLPPEHIGVYLPGVLQRICALDNEWEYCWWTMDGPLSLPMTLGFNFRTGVHHASPAPLPLIRKLQTVIRRPDRNSELQASMLVYRLLCAAALSRVPARTRTLDEKLVQVARDTIDEHWNDVGFGADALAGMLNVHRSALSRRFKQVTGTTIIDYITNIRVQNAMTLLKQSTFTIGEIALRCGYADPNYFSRLLRKRFGVPPSQFRGMM